MKAFTDIFKQVIAAMRPIDISYGQPMIDYMATYAANTDLTQAPFDMFGHRVEIANRLIDKDKEDSYSKYPLIALGMDFPETPKNGLVFVKVNIAIMMLTKQNLNAEERQPEVFAPVLTPIYERLIKEINNIDAFSWVGDQRMPPHDPVKHPYYGTPGSDGNTANIYADTLDAIELLNLELYFSSKNCLITI